MSQLFTSGGQSTGASISASLLPMNNSGLISFRIDWFDLLVVQGTLKSLLQHHNSIASNLQPSAFFMMMELGKDNLVLVVTPSTKFGEKIRSRTCSPRRKKFAGGGGDNRGSDSCMASPT